MVQNGSLGAAFNIIELQLHEERGEKGSAWLMSGLLAHMSMVGTSEQASCKQVLPTSNQTFSKICSSNFHTVIIYICYYQRLKIFFNSCYILGSMLRS